MSADLTPIEVELRDMLGFCVHHNQLSKDKFDFVIKYKGGTGWKRGDEKHFYLWKLLAAEAEKCKVLEENKVRAGRDALKRERKRLITLLTRAGKEFPHLDPTTLAFSMDIVSSTDAEKTIFGGVKII